MALQTDPNRSGSLITSPPDHLKTAKKILVRLCETFGVDNLQVDNWNGSTIHASFKIGFSQVNGEAYFLSVSPQQLRQTLAKIKSAAKPAKVIVHKKPIKHYRQAGGLNVPLGYDSNIIKFEINLIGATHD